ncbi:hypothetical protein R6Q59_022500 [Mikania micrantha]
MDESEAQVCASGGLLSVGVMDTIEQNECGSMPAIGSKLMTAESSLMIDLNSSWNGARPGRRCLRVAPVLVQSRRMALLKRMKAVCMDDMTVLAIRGCNVPGRTASELVMNRWKSSCRIQLLDDIMVVSSIGMQ